MHTYVSNKINYFPSSQCVSGLHIFNSVRKALQLPVSMGVHWLVNHRQHVGGTVTRERGLMLSSR